VNIKTLMLVSQHISITYEISNVNTYHTELVWNAKKTVLVFGDTQMTLTLHVLCAYITMTHFTCQLGFRVF